jgi:hypothetical protein
MYASRGPKTVSHDVNRLEALGLITSQPRLGLRPNTAVMDAFVPPRRH